MITSKYPRSKLGLMVISMLFIYTDIASAWSLFKKEDWKDVVPGSVYYDASSLKETRVGYTATLKIYLDKYNLIQRRRSLGFKTDVYDNYDYTIIYCGLNCSARQFYISRIDDFDKKGKTLYSVYVGKRKYGGKAGRPNYEIVWQPISDGSEFGIIPFYRTVCK